VDIIELSLLGVNEDFTENRAEEHADVAFVGVVLESV
jgi:hypothetical protein